MGISVVLVDDQRLLLAGTRCLLERATGFTVPAAVTDLDQAVAAVAEHRPDVVLLDLSLPGCTGADAVRRLAEQAPGPLLVALAEADDEALAAECRAAGASLVLARDTDPEDLLAALHAAGLTRAA